MQFIARWQLQFITIKYVGVLYRGFSVYSDNAI